VKSSCGEATVEHAIVQPIERQQGELTMTDVSSQESAIHYQLWSLARCLLSLVDHVTLQASGTESIWIDKAAHTYTVQYACT